MYAVISSRLVTGAYYVRSPLYTTASVTSGLLYQASHKLMLLITLSCLQQAEVLRKHTNLRVAHYCGDMNVDYWDRRRWAKELAEQDVWVMTPQILLNILRHGFIKVWPNSQCAWQMGK